jgi:hypothetical protein
MMKANAAPGENYRLIASFKTEEGVFAIWHSPGQRDPSWDEFLMKTPSGQFQQSSMWARVKEVDGWENLRVVAAIDDAIVGGFQILWRQTRLGRIGYVSKGPLAVPEAQTLLERLVGLMCDQARENKIHALICQPPDESRITSDILDRRRFIRSNPMGVIENTLLVDVSHGPDAIDRRMSKKDSLRKVRIARQSGIAIREGTIDDVPLFFSLMSSTCNRQGVKPNPPTKEALQQLWLAFTEHDCLHMTFAEYNGEAVAGNLDIAFGKKVSLWKKGWNFKHADRYPNDLLYYESLHWACRNNYDHCDIGAFDRDLADAMQNGTPLTNAQKKSPNVFHLRFGGTPKILPPARIWIANPILRFGFENVFLPLKQFYH